LRLLDRLFKDFDMERVLLFVLLIIVVFFSITFAGYVKAWKDGELSAQKNYAEYEAWESGQTQEAEITTIDIQEEEKKLQDYNIYSESKDGPLGEASDKDLENFRAAFITNMGTIIVKFYIKESPAHVRNFLSAVENEYAGKQFYKVWKDDVIFGGGPLEDARKSYLADSKKRNPRAGDIGMLALGANQKARSNTASRLFFICVKDKPEWDGDYSIFGKVEKGMDVVKKISAVRVLQGYEPKNKIKIVRAKIIKLPDVEKNTGK